MDDFKIIEHILNGHVDDYEQLMKKYNYELFSYVFNMVGSYHDTEDIVQDIFIKAYDHLDKYNKDKASFRTWLYKIATNHTINFLKIKSRTVATIDDSFYDIPDSSDMYQDLEKEDQIRILIDTMNVILNTKQLKIMQLHFFSDLSANEISESLGIPLKTVYRIISSSILKIQKEVNQDE